MYNPVIAFLRGGPWCPSSRLEIEWDGANKIRIFMPNVVDPYFYGITPEQASYEWILDRDLLEVRDDVLNGAGMFDLGGYTPGLIQRGQSINPTSIHGNQMKMYFDDEGRFDYSNFWGTYFMRRRDLIQTEGDILLLNVYYGFPGFSIKSNIEHRVFSSFDQIMHTYFRPVVKPYQFNYSGPTTVQGNTPLPIDFSISSIRDDGYIPPKLETFVANTNKGSVPQIIPMVNNQGQVIFDPTGMEIGETAKVRIGIDWLRHSDTVEITKTG